MYLQFSDAVKTSLKLEFLSRQQSSDSRREEYLLDLGKALYKLHFQLLLLVEASNKMVATLVSALQSSQVNTHLDISTAWVFLMLGLV